MFEGVQSKNHFLTLCLGTWVAYMLATVLLFPALNITILMFSIALSMVGAWLYGFSGCLITTALSIPYHYLLLRYHSDDPSFWNEAFNPFGISTQVLISGAVALLRRLKRKLERLNGLLKHKIEERTEELDRIQRYIIQNHETSQVLLSSMLLGDLGDSLSGMLVKSDAMLNRLVSTGNPASYKAARLHDMINDCIHAVENLEFVDHFFTDKQTGFANAIRNVAEHYTKTTNIKFDLRFHIEHENMPKQVQHQLYRIAREGITNAVRHANPTHIRIHLNIIHHTYDLVLINDGIPMPPEVDKGLGMKLMHHRAQQLGGSIAWTRSETGETRLRCCVPLPSD